jgi:hypothetical protein
VKILDFGVAKILQEGSGGELTQTGEFLGKLAYASHELLTFGQIDFRSDIYSLGVIFFRLLTKRRPINVQNSRNYLEWVMAQENRAPIDFSVPEGNPPIPASLQALIVKMLAKKSDDRPQGYEEIIDALVAAQAEAEKAGLVPDPEIVSTLPTTEAKKSLSGSAGSPGGLGGTPSPSGNRPGGATAATGLFDDGAYPFTEAETIAPSSASRVGADGRVGGAATPPPAAAPARTAAPASQVPDWLEQAGYDEQIQVMSESRGISRSPVHPVFGTENRSRSVKRDTESIRTRQRAEAKRKRNVVLIALFVLAVLGTGAWAGWEFYVKPNMPSTSPATLAPPVPPVASGPLPSGSGADTTLPTSVPEPRMPVNRAAKLGAEERRLVDANIIGFFPTGDGQGLNVVFKFRKPVNVSGIPGARIAHATDVSGQPLPALSGAEAEIRLTDDPTGAMRLRLFIRGAGAADASSSLRTIVVQLGPATIRAKYDKELLSR